MLNEYYKIKQTEHDEMAECLFWFCVVMVPLIVIGLILAAFGIVI